jgi:hypothetical protein
MIHSLALSETPADTAQTRAPSYRLPADYYAAPPGELRPIFPRWVPIGCGSAAAAFLVAGFIGGAVVMHKGLGTIMAFALDMSVGEMKPMIGKDVPADRREALTAELSQLSKNVEADKTSLVRLEPVLTALKEAIEDKKVTPVETERLIKLAHEANQPRQAKAPVVHKH